MAKLTKKYIENLREFMDRGCEYSGTQETVNDLVHETLKEIGTECPYGNEVSLYDGSEFCTVTDFTNLFWDKAVECILNAIETQ